MRTSNTLRKLLNQHLLINVKWILIDWIKTTNSLGYLNRTSYLDCKLRKCINLAWIDMLQIKYRWETSLQTNIFTLTTKYIPNIMMISTSWAGKHDAKRYRNLYLSSKCIHIRRFIVVRQSVHFLSHLNYKSIFTP